MLSIGVLLPESSCISSRIGITSRPNWPMELAMVPSRMPSAATASA